MAQCSQVASKGKNTLSSAPFRENWLSENELEVTRRLEKASLVVEINLDENEIRIAQEMYGQQAGVMLQRGLSPDAVIAKYPALTLAILVGQAALGYEQHRYWDEFFARLELPREQSFEQSLRKALRRLLIRFGLRDFPELGSEYVQLMALHAGFPVYCMTDIVTVLEDRMSAGTELSGAAVIEWLREPGKKNRMNVLDVPVRNFIQYGDQLAVDVLDRVIEFIAYTTKTESWLDNDIDLETSTTGLPTLLLSHLIDMLEAHPFGSGSRSVVVRTRRRSRAAISLHPLDRQIVVEVPYPSVDPEVPWRLSFDGESRELLAERGWGVRAGEEHPRTAVPVPMPVREILLNHQPSDEKISLTVVDKDDPLLVFDEAGNRIPRGTALPRGSVLAVYPNDAQIVDAGTDRTVSPVGGVTDVPVGWRGWVVAELDLSACVSIILERRGTRSSGGVRMVRDAAAPTFEHGEAVAGLNTLNGLSVYGTRPEVVLPANPGRMDVAWQVRVRRTNSEEWLVDTNIFGADEDLAIDPFATIEDAVIGLFEIHVSGPVGTDLRQQAFLAEGISVESSLPFRQPVAGGLEPVVCTVRSEWDLEVPYPRVDYGIVDRDKLVTVAQGALSYRLRLTPNYVQVRVDPVGTPAQWRTAAPVLTPDELDQDRHIAMHAPGVEAAVFQLEASDGRILKDVTPDTPRYEYFQAPSRVFVDVARRAGRCRVVALADDETGKTTKIVLTHIRPAALCLDITVDDGDLMLMSPADEEDLAVNIWAATAPWLPALSLRVTDGRVKLPESYIGAGALLAQVFVDDPWGTPTPPSWPDDTAFSVAQVGWMHDEARGRDNLSRFLAGAGPAPAGAVNMPEVWAALALLPQDSEDTHTQQLRSALGRILNENSRAALEALGHSTIPKNQMVSLLIRTGLVYRSFAADSTLNELHANPWVGCMVEIADLPSLYARREYVSQERAQTLDYLEDKGGAVLMEALRKGKSNDLYWGVFDKGTMLFDKMPETQVEAMIEYARLVPGALLDEDTRVSSAIDAFHARQQWTKSGWSPAFGSATLRTLEVIKRTRGQIYREITARSENLHSVDTTMHRWMLLSLQSLTLAVLARLHAHGMLRHEPLTADFDEGWATMARLCPALVMTDLLIAEAIVTHARHGDLIGELA